MQEHPWLNRRTKLQGVQSKAPWLESVLLHLKTEAGRKIIAFHSPQTRCLVEQQVPI